MGEEVVHGGHVKVHGGEDEQTGEAHEGACDVEDNMVVGRKESSCFQVQKLLLVFPFPFLALEDLEEQKQS
jgi:hypothetical protein